MTVRMDYSHGLVLTMTTYTDRLTCLTVWKTNKICDISIGDSDVCIWGKIDNLSASLQLQWIGPAQCAQFYVSLRRCTCNLLRSYNMPTLQDSLLCGYFFPQPNNAHSFASYTWVMAIAFARSSYAFAIFIQPVSWLESNSINSCDNPHYKKNISLKMQWYFKITQWYTLLVNKLIRYCSNEMLNITGCVIKIIWSNQ